MSSSFPVIATLSPCKLANSKEADEGASVQAAACSLSLTSIALRSANGTMSISTYHMLGDLANYIQRNLA